MQITRRPGSINKDTNSESEDKICDNFHIPILQDTENKERLSELTLLFFKQNATYCLAKMNTDTVALFFDVKVVNIESSNFILMPCLISYQEETDTKVVLHAEVLLEDKNDTITIRLPSGDTDPVILVISLLCKFKRWVILGDGHEKNRKKISDVDIKSDIVDVLIGRHISSGNAYISL